MSELPTGNAMRLRMTFASEWKTGKARQDKVKDFLLQNVPGIEIKEVGFGAGTTEMLYTKNPNPGDPDLEVTYKGQLVTFIEVTGGRNPWPGTVLVRVDKLTHAKRNPYDPIWYAHVCGMDLENVFCHDLGALLRHEFETVKIERDGAQLLQAVVVPRYETKSLSSLVEWIGWKKEFIEKVFGV